MDPISYKIEQKRLLKVRFMQSSGFPGAIAAIDCTHIVIIVLAVEEHINLNRKGFYSKNVQIVIKILHDSCYPKQPWVMTLFLNAVPNTPEAAFTETVIGGRNCNECLKYHPDKVGHIINACTILHNIGVEGRIDNDFEIEIQNDDVDTGNQVLLEGNIARQNLIR
ncbi:hypothetical protein NQ314_006382 [Rhamnusium bicolor]|uniref:Uncharacterized protein n=1 Tax=Rhamnusium bicolor TaxID=1586634 RepID=A0AAV8Z5D3_9CUCU|nr:hypothetical protein NQ314_006382 [Rhamnusium bicolor]